MGQPQFMPSSYLRYAEDFDGDGPRDIWNSQADVFASIANYLKAYGWDGDGHLGPSGARCPAPVTEMAERAGSRGEGCRAERALSRRQSLAEWQAMGVRTADGGNLPTVDRQASLLDAGDRQFLVYANYEAILGYNCANAYALSVAMLGDRMRARAAMRQFHQASMPPPRPRRSRPPLWQVVATAIGAVAAMVAALYFAGQQLTPIALVGTTLFVRLGGLRFELARRRVALSREPPAAAPLRPRHVSGSAAAIPRGRLSGMNAKLLKGMNEHLKLEFKASHEYLAMSVWLSATRPAGLRHLDAPAVERRAHCTRRSSSTTWSSATRRWCCRRVAQPPMAWESVEALCAHVLQNEQAVTASINELYAHGRDRQGPPGGGAAAVVRQRADGRGSGGARHPRPHPARRHDRRRAC